MSLPDTPLLDEILRKRIAFSDESSAFLSRDYQGIDKDTRIKICVVIEEILQMFTQQHYEKLASLIDDQLKQADTAVYSSHAREVLSGFVYEMIKMLEADNPKFKKMHFIEAAFGPSNAQRATKEKT